MGAGESNGMSSSSLGMGVGECTSIWATYDPFPMGSGDMSISVQPGDESAGRGGVVWYSASHQSHVHPVKTILPALTFPLKSTHYSVRCEKSPTRRWEEGTVVQSK